jgi:hypothetical protein
MSGMRQWTVMRRVGSGNLATIGTIVSKRVHVTEHSSLVFYDEDRERPVRIIADGEWSGVVNAVEGDDRSQ